MRDHPIGDRPRTGTRSNHRATSSSTAVAPTLPTTAPMMEPVIRTSTTMSASLVIHRATLTAATSRKRPRPVSTSRYARATLKSSRSMAKTRR